MLTGKELGEAIKVALKQNGKSQADAMRFFDVKAPSINGWIKTGRITKDNFDKLRVWLDKTPSSFWGAESEPVSAGKKQVAPLLEQLLDVMGQACAAMNDEQRKEVGSLLAMYTANPRESIKQVILEALCAVANKPSEHTSHLTKNSPEKLLKKG